MQLLAIETTGQKASAALYKDGFLYALSNESEFSHLQEITPLISKIIAAQNVQIEMLDAIAVSQGPGSFTGIRIGMATAKGLAFVWNKPVICVPTLQSFAFSDYAKTLKNILLCPIFDARRSQVYTAAYEPFSMNAVLSEKACSIEDLAKDLKSLSKNYEKICFFGDGIRTYGEFFAENFSNSFFAKDEEQLQNAKNVAILAAKLFDKGNLSDCYLCEPEYLRAAEAERKRMEKC